MPVKEGKIWWQYTVNSFQQILLNKIAVVFLMLGKIIRIALFFIFLMFLFQGAKTLAGYNRNQIIFFYLSFNLVDTFAQLFFREVYRFRSMVVSGSFDFYLVKPMNPLIRILLGGTDLMDLLILILIIITTVWFATANNLISSPWQWGLYLILVLNSLLIAAAFHISVLGVGIMTTSVDHLIMIYRDFSSMLRIPVDLYTEPIRFLLTFALPLGIMITFPAKALLGILSPSLFLISLLFGAVSLFLSLKFWSFALKKYTSAS